MGWTVPAPLSAPLPATRTAPPRRLRTTVRWISSYDQRTSRLAAVPLLRRLIAGQIVRVVGVITVGRALGDVVQHGPEQPDREAIEHLELCSRDLPIAVAGTQHDE